MTTITFGKYSGKSIDDVAKSDPEYCRWSATNSTSVNWRNAFREALKRQQSTPNSRVPQFGKHSMRPKRVCPDCGKALRHDEDYADSDNKWVCPACN